MSFTFLPHAYRIINVQIDTESRRILRWALSAHDPLVQMLIDDAAQANAQAAKPAS
jgi:hypothetical protein